MNWRFWRRAAESRSYTEEAIERGLAIAQGRNPEAAQIAAAQYAATLLGRALAGAEIEADPIIARLFAPPVLDQIGRSLVTRGEIFYDLAFGRQLQLIPAVFNDCRGEADPASWVYDLDVYAPRGTLAIRRPAAAVLHFRYATSPIEPWRGQSPLAAAKHSADLAASVESKLAAEIGRARVKNVLPAPLTGEPLTQFRKDLGGGRDGGLVTAPTMASGFGQGAANAPRSDYRLVRLGADPPTSITQLRDPAAQSVLASCGIQPGLWAGDDGIAAREAWRQYLHAVGEPLAELLAAEIEQKLERPVRIRIPSAAYVDLQSRARALRAMTQAEIDKDRALALCGFA